jgi:peptide/nickel transport system permease protein
MLSEGRQFMQSAPRMIFYPGMTIVLNVIIFNLLGDSLRDILDPRFTKKKKNWRNLKLWQKNS